MIKRVVIMIIFFMTFIKVDALSYDITLKTSEPEVLKNSLVDVYINLSNISGIPDGLNVCELKLEYDSKDLVINSIKGINDWSVTVGEKIILDSYNSITKDIDIAHINLKVLNQGTFTVNDVNCTDGTNEYSTNSSTLKFNIKNVENKLSSNENIKKISLKAIIAIFLIILLIVVIIIKIISKKKIFKK